MLPRNFFREHKNVSMGRICCYLQEKGLRNSKELKDILLPTKFYNKPKIIFQDKV
jgi:hypothetical protein